MPPRNFGSGANGKDSPERPKQEPTLPKPVRGKPVVTPGNPVIFRRPEGGDAGLKPFQSLGGQPPMYLGGATAAPEAECG